MTHELRRLSSGWFHLRLSSECWAQFLPTQRGPIADEFIFHPSWNRQRINDWWQKYEAQYDA